ncbi:TPA: hypothetical protein QHZ57_001158 [Escherichia coli]|nr:hypothetical protein [Escherichia coli]
MEIFTGKGIHSEWMNKWWFAVFLLFSQGVNAGASFYMNAVTAPIVGSASLPSKVYIGAEYTFNVPFPGSTNMIGHVLRSGVCERPKAVLKRNWALAVPEKIDLSSQNGPVLQFKSSNGWYFIGYVTIDGVKHKVLWSQKTVGSVPCEEYISDFLEKVNGHMFGGPANFVYEVVDPGKPGAGNIDIPSGSIPGFRYANLRREGTISEEELKSYVLTSPQVFDDNQVSVNLKWETQQSCTTDNRERVLDFGTMLPSQVEGKKKNLDITISCKGGTQTTAIFDIVTTDGHNSVSLGHGISADLSISPSSQIIIPFDGENTAKLTAELKGKASDGGELNGNAIVRITFQ